MKKLLFTFFLLPVFILAQESIRDYVDRVNNTETLKHAVWGVYAEYTDTGEPIIDFNSEKSLAPASGLKVFTTSAALAVLGENYRYETKLYYDGSLTEDGVLNGNIYIVGSGDPTLGSSQVNKSLDLNQLMGSWILAFQQKGIKSVKGSIIADDLIFERNPVPDYWPYIDIGNYYGAGTSGLCINDNLYYLFFKPGPMVNDPALVIRTEPVIPGLDFLNFMKTGRPGSGDNGYIYNAPFQYTAVLRGTIPAGVNEFSIKGSIPDPALFTAQHFKRVLEQNNITVSGTARKSDITKNYETQKLITSTFSPSLKDIVYITNKRSNNLYTEQLLRTIASKKTESSTTESGIIYLLNYLRSIGVPVEGIELYDGCGLSRTDMITPKAMVRLLVNNTKQNYYDSFYKSLGVAGDASDISFYKQYGVNSSIAHNARIKSGLINGVRSHSGYLKALNGRNIAFSFIANNYSGTSSDVDKMHIDLMIKLTDLKN